MKKILLFLGTLTIITTLFIGCNYNLNSISFNKTKPNNFYYTNILAKNLTLESTCKAIILNTNFYREKELEKESIDSIRNLLKSFNKNNFIPKPKDLPDKPSYKIYLTFSKEKLIINVYSEKYISIYPWDGSYPMDYIDMSSTPVSLNLFSLCKYIFN